MAFEIRYDISDCPVLQQFFRSNAKVRGIMGPVGSGKSSACAMEIYLRSLRQAPGPDGVRRTRWFVVRNTYPQLRDTTIRTFLDWFPPRYFGRFHDTKHEYTMAFNGPPGPDGKPTKVVSEVWFRALDRPDQVENLKSNEFTGAWINEACDVPESVVSEIVGRCGRYPSRRDGIGATWDGVFMDTNAPDTDNWWYKWAELTRPEGVEFFRQPPAILVEPKPDGGYIFLGVNPKAENLKNLKPDYYPTQFHVRSPESIKRYLLNEYCYAVDGKPVFPEYKDHLHFNEKLAGPVRGVPIYRCWDFGRTPCIVLFQLDPQGRVLVFDERVSEDMGIEQFASLALPYCNSKYPGFAWVDVGDPAGAQPGQHDDRTCFSILQAKGVDIMPGMQTLAMRLESVRKALTSLIDGRPMFQIGPGAPTLRKALQGGYHYRRLRTSGERYTDAPDKNKYSHVADALQYGLTLVISGHLIPDSGGDYHGAIERPTDEDGFYL